MAIFSNPETENNSCFSVSQITNQIKAQLENHFFGISIKGEISNCRPANSGHLYFTLKDKEASLSALMFKGRQSGLSFKPTDGQQVIVQGSISVYPPRGSYQIICESIQLAGEGELLALLEQSKKKLAAQGLFDNERKLPIPQFPSRVAIITSPTGAALRDILNVMGRRNSGLNLQIFPATVQGNDAAKEIAARIKQVNRFKQADVIIIGRGGGSVEDLLPFSQEIVVLAIAESTIPIISAVGHEIDWALSDYVSDLRAPTPSAAAELVTGEREKLLESLKRMNQDNYRMLQQRCERLKSDLEYNHPIEMVRFISQRIDQNRLRLDNRGETLFAAIKNKMEQSRHRLEIVRQGIEDQSPHQLQKKGLVRLLKKEGAVITSIKNLSLEDQVSIEMIDGKALAKIVTIENE